jgi:anaerobic dimethyl sulfoxide reductase subunit B (iron-sulfur subunit)
MNKQLGFYFDAGRCIQCHACEIACKAAHEAELGVKWRRVLNYWQGEYPRVVNRNFSLSCMHCALPACRDACPKGAITKRAEDGIVVVDAEACNGCRQCADACPYGAPQFGQDGTMQKCDLCLGSISDLRQRGDEPACVATCPGQALAFGYMETLAKLAAANSGEKLPGITQPSFFVTSADAGLLPRVYVMKFFCR